jgi:hypothetical protein
MNKKRVVKVVIFGVFVFLLLFVAPRLPTIVSNYGLVEFGNLLATLTALYLSVVGVAALLNAVSERIPVEKMTYGFQLGFYALAPLILALPFIVLNEGVWDGIRVNSDLSVPIYWGVGIFTMVVRRFFDHLDT